MKVENLFHENKSAILFPNIYNYSHCGNCKVKLTVAIASCEEGFEHIYLYINNKPV